MSLRTRALFLAGLFVAVSCSDAGNPAGPETPRPSPAPEGQLQALDCTLNVPSGALSCAASQPGTGAARGAGDLIVGGQNVFVTLAASNFQNLGVDTLAIDVTVKNLIHQAMGTDDGVTPHPDGVRVFFVEGPISQPTGTAGVGNPDGSAIFLTASQEYFQYSQIIRHDSTSAPRTWKLTYTPGVTTNIHFKVLVWARVQYENGWVQVTPAVDTIAPGGTAGLAGTARDKVGRTGTVSQTLTWSSSNESVATVDAGTGVVTGVAAGTVTITATNGTQSGSATIVVNTPPAFQVDSILAISNVTIPEPAPGVLEGANDGDSHTVSVVPGTVATVRGGTATLAADGSLTYLSRSGFAGRDTIPFQITDGVTTTGAYAIVDVSPSNYWYVQAGATGDGRDQFPFGSLASAQDSAAAGDSILVLSAGVTQLDGGITLETGQGLIGQGIGASIERTVNGQTVTILAAGSAPGLTRTDAGATVTLGTNNVIRGLGIDADAGAAIAGTSFGTLFVRETAVNPAGPALALSTGAVDAVFSTLSSTGSGTTGISLTGLTGSLTGSAGAISGATGAAFQVSGGSAAVSYAGSVSGSGGISISGVTGGSITLSGALNLTGSGIDIQNNTGGTISFTGSSKSISTGANGAVSMASNTGATIEFAGGGLAVSTTSGAGFGGSGGGTVSVTGAGNTIGSTTGTALSLSGMGTGTNGVSFLSVSADGAANGIVLSNLTGAGVQVTGSGSTAGSGGTIQNTTLHAVSLSSMGADSVHLQNMNVTGGASGNAGIFGSSFGTLRVTGMSVGATGGPALSLATGTLNGGFSSLGSSGSASNGVILNTVNGSFTAAAGTISNATSTGFAVVGGGVSATYQGGISQSVNNVALVSVAGTHTGTLTFNTGTLSASAGTGLQFNDADGSYTFGGTTTLNGGDAGIDVIGGSAGTFTFGAGTSITDPSGHGLNVNGSAPTLSYAGTISTAASRPAVVDGMTGGTVTVTGSVTSTAQGILAQNSSGGTIAFDGASKSLTTGANAAVTLTNNNGATVRFGGGGLAIGTTTGAAFTASGGGTVQVSGANNTISSGNTALSLSGVSTTVTGVNFQTVNATLSGAAKGVLLSSVSGGVNVNGGTITGGTDSVFVVRGGTVTVDWSGSMSQANGAPLVAVAGGHGSGTLTFATGTLSATGGSGLQFSDADGTYAFSGTTTLNGGDAGIDITSGSSGTFTFGTGVSITNPSGTAFNHNGSTAGVTYSGAIAKSGTSPGRIVDVTNQASGTITFQTGTLSSTSSAGTGILLSNADGTVAFNGTTTLNGGDAGIDVENGSGGTITFTSSATVANPTNEAIRINGSAPTFTYPGAFSKANNNVTGILVSNNTGGTITFSGSGVTKSVSSGTAAAVNLSSNTGATVNFTNGGLAITTTTGTGFNATGGGTVTVTGSNNTVSTGGGRVVNIQNTNIGSGNVTFRSVTGTGSGVGVKVENTGSLGGFKITGDGSTASSGGILTLNAVTAADSAAFSFTNTANVSLEFVRVEVTTGGGAGGIAAINLSGTNLVRNSVFDYNQVTPDPVPLHNAHAMRFVQNNTNATITVDGSSVNGTRAGASAGVLSAQGNSVVTFNVIDSNTGDGFQSLYTDLFGSAWVIGAGDNTGSTATVNLTVRDTRFTNAAPNGTNNLEMSAFQNATMNYKVKDNLFQNVANASCICGIINVNTLDAGVFGANTAMDSIVGNTITNTGTSSAVADLGYIPMRIAFDNSTATANRVVIANNTITDSWRQGLLLSTRQASTGHIKVINNTIGTAALPVGQSNRRGIETDLQASSVMHLEVTGNSVTGAGSVDAASAIGLRAGNETGSATLNATVLNNTIRSTSASTGARFRAEALSVGTPTICLDLRTNNLEDNTKLYKLQQSGGTFRVEGAGTGAVTNAAITAANTSGTGDVTGTVNFNNNTNCTQPAI